MKHVRVIFVLSSLLAGLLSQQASVASAPEWLCNGKEATVEGHEGTEGDDVIVSEGPLGGEDHYEIRGHGGNDTICVFLSEEIRFTRVDIYAGDGDDWVDVDGFYNYAYVWGEGGNDHLQADPDMFAFLNGGPGDDTIKGQAPANVAVLEDVGDVVVHFATGIVTTEDGTDTLVGNPAVLGGAGDDVFWGTKGRQFVNGGPGNDRIFGGPGADALDGGPGDDVVRGGRGRDLLSGGLGDDDIRGNKGIDYLWLQPYLRSGKVTETFPFDYGLPGESSFPRNELGLGVHADLFSGYLKFEGAEATLRGIENIYSFDGDDILIGNAKRNTIIGGRGHDRISGYGENDRLYGGIGFDRINGGAGEDLCVGGRVYKGCEKRKRYAPIKLY